MFGRRTSCPRRQSKTLKKWSGLVLRRAGRLKKKKKTYLRRASVRCCLRGAGWGGASRGSCPGTWASGRSGSRPRCRCRSPSPQTDDTLGEKRKEKRVSGIVWRCHRGEKSPLMALGNTRQNVKDAQIIVDTQLTLSNIWTGHMELCSQGENIKELHMFYVEGGFFSKT